MAVKKGKTKSGIKFQIDDRIKDDARFLYLLTKMQKNKEKKTEEALSEASSALFSLLGLVFGSDEALTAFMEAVAGAHGGICSIKDMIAEMTEIFEAMNAKNS